MLSIGLGRRDRAFIRPCSFILVTCHFDTYGSLHIPSVIDRNTAQKSRWEKTVSFIFFRIICPLVFSDFLFTFIWYSNGVVTALHAYLCATRARNCNYIAQKWLRFSHGLYGTAICSDGDRHLHWFIVFDILTKLYFWWQLCCEFLLTGGARVSVWSDIEAGHMSIHGMDPNGARVGAQISLRPRPPTVFLSISLTDRHSN